MLLVSSVTVSAEANRLSVTCDIFYRGTQTNSSQVHLCFHGSSAIMFDGAAEEGKQNR